MTTNLHYLAPIRLPTEKAHGLQIMQNCEALAAQGAQVTLYPARRFQPPELSGVDPWTYYDVPPAFRLRYTPNVDLLPLAGQSTGLRARAAFLLQLATYNAALWAMLHGTPPGAVFYSRHPQVLSLVRRYKPARSLYWEVHSLSGDPARRRGQADLVGHIGGAITVTQHMADDLIANGAPAERVTVAPDGIRAARFATMPTQAEARAALNLPQDAFIIGYMGRLHTLNMSKGVDDVVSAIARQPERPLHLMLVGGPDEMVEAYRMQWANLGLPAARFHALGQIAAADVPRALAAFDVPVMPFPWTAHFAYYASPIKLFEYMASGRAIVATDLPSTAEIVTDGDTALLVPPSDAEALAGALTRLYEDAALRARLAENARQAVFERYTWEARARSILGFIERRK
jgi:glycosyltransferase involved in cell wall biosynthesis